MFKAPTLEKRIDLLLNEARMELLSKELELLHNTSSVDYLRKKVEHLSKQKESYDALAQSAQSVA